MQIRRLNALIVKEFFQIIRDPSSLLISVMMPLILMFIYGFGLSLDLDHIQIGLVLEEDSKEASSFAASFCNSRYFDVHLGHSRQELERMLISGQIKGIVVVPSYFTAFLKSHTQVAPIQVIADGSEPNTASFVQNYVQGVWGVWLQQEKISSGFSGLPLVTTQTRYWYNEQLKSRNVLIPGSLAIIMTLVGTLLTSLVVSREWERGTMEAIMSTPVTQIELLLGKFIPYYLLALCSMCLCVFIALFLYDIPLRGSLFALWLVTTCFLFAALSLGIFISATSKTQLVASQWAITVGFFPAFMLSGFIFEIASMPLWIQCFTYLIPARYFVTCLQTIFLVGDVWGLIIVELIPMSLLGASIFWLVLKKTAKRLD